MSNHPLRLLLDFDARSQRDREQSAAFLHRRDRRFALDCEQQGRQPDAAGWLAHLDRLSGPGGGISAGRQTERYWRRVNAGFAVTGAIVGIATMAGLLFYDGGLRINITVILAFVLLQLLLALLTTTQALVGWQPWRWLARRLGRHSVSPVLASLHPLLMARAAHTGGSAFAATGLLTLLVMVVVQDLAFGWSTTLDTAASSYHALVQAVAIPWAWLWPEAVPGLELIEATRFFRAGPATGQAAPVQWGKWWPFVVMLWTTWVLLPRLVLVLFSQALLRHRARRLLASHPAMRALLYRMETPALDTGNQHNDADHQPDERTRTGLTPLPDTPLVLCWAGAGEPELPAPLLPRDGHCVRAGGRASLAEDDAVLTALGQRLRDEGQRQVLVVTRGWEPPTGELQDFLEAAEQRWPDGSQVTLVPLAPDPRQAPPQHLILPWLRFSERLPGGFAHVSLADLEWHDPWQAEGGDL